MSLTNVQLPPFVYWLGYAVVAAIVIGVVVLIVLKIRNSRLPH